MGNFLQIPPIQSLLNIISGLFIIWLGIYMMFRSRSVIVRGEKKIRHNAFLPGILATLLNPVFLPWWLTIGSMFVMQFRQIGTTGLLAFIIAVEIPSLIWYPFVSIATYRTGTMERGVAIKQWLFVICSLTLIGFGFWFIFTGVNLAFE